MTVAELNKELGNIDLYLLDQVLKGKIDKSMKILDAGCGEGRNLVHFINNGYEVYGVDANLAAIRMLQMVAKGYEKERFQVSSIEKMIYPPNTFDYIISSAVLHFAKGHGHFDEMMSKMVEVLKPGGTIFIRMATDMGIGDEIIEKGDGVYNLPDVTERYLFKEENMEGFLKKHKLKPLENPKSVIVVNQRSMGVFVLQKQKLK